MDCLTGTEGRLGAVCSQGTDSGGRAVLTAAATAQSCSKNILVN
jgi:hypothetical protein